MILIKFGKSAEPIDPEPFRRCQFCIELQEPEGPDYLGPGPEDDEVSNLQKIVIYFFQIFSKKYKNHFDFF